MSFQGYISYPITSEPTDLLNDAYTFIKGKVPDWVEHDGNLDVWILQVTASQASDLLGIAADVPDTIFKFFGAKLIGIPPMDSTPAVVGSTWTMIDNLGHTIPAGTTVSIRDDVGMDHGFQTSNDIIIPAGSMATAAGAVTLTSIETGSLLTGLGGSGYAATLIDQLAYVDTVVLTGATTGGQDAELSSDYNNRLSRKLQRLSQRPILGTDYSLAALDVAGVARCVALDGFNPGDGTMNNQRYVGVAAVDANGVPVSGTIKANLQSYLDSQREVNFVVLAFDPTVTQIDVTFNVKCLVGYTAATVQANAVAAIQNYLNPANWGKDPTITDATAQATTWVETNMVYYWKVIQVLGQAEGVDRVISMTMGIHGGALGNADIALPGHGCLVNPGTITGTATP
jgi:hypothetical protein